MKRANIFLLLVLLFGASGNVLADCWNPDCWDANNVWSSDPYCVGDVAYRNYAAYYECSGGGTCDYVGTGPHVYDNCTKHATETCVNGDFYNMHNICDNGRCRVDSDWIVYAGPSACDLCKVCSDAATEPRSLAQTYNKDFTGEHVLENGTYYVSPNNRLFLTNINSIVYNCGNTMLYDRRSSLFVWVYNITGGKKALKHNGVAIDDALNRSEVIGASSDPACGTAVTNVYDTMLFGYPLVHNRTGIANSTLPNIYNFVTPGKYTVFIDAMGAYCGPTTPNQPEELTQNYICPWLGGNLARSSNCKSDVGKVVDGWNERENFLVVVPNPNITFAAPTNETLAPGTKIQKTWAIINRGVGRIKMNISYDCGTWTCAFSPIPGINVPLEENNAYGVTLNITVGAPEVNHSAGIIVTYDEGYGISAIARNSASSYIRITSTGGLPVPFVNVALNQPMPGSAVTSNVTLNYTITGTNNTYNSSLNLNGSANYLTDAGKNNDTKYGFALQNLAPGFYKWNVTGYINSSIYATSQTWNFTVISAATPWVNVTLNQPASGSAVPSNVTLNYTITGTNNTYNSSLNLNGSINNQTGTGKLNNALNNFTLLNLKPGYYSWNVTGYINDTIYATSQTWNFTVASATASEPVYIT
jgi:hypothetical protein